MPASSAVSEAFEMTQESIQALEEPEQKRSQEDEGWFAKRVASATKNDRLKSGERVGEVIGALFFLVVASFFIYHQMSSTGFFTSGFGPWEAFLFYVTVPLGVTTAAVRATTGRRNTARPVEILTGTAWVVTSVWMFVVFPFNFVHFADVLPSSLRFLLSWVSDDIARFVLLTVGIAGAVMSVYTPALYVSVRRKLAHMQEPLLGP